MHDHKNMKETLSKTYHQAIEFLPKAMQSEHNEIKKPIQINIFWVKGLYSSDTLHLQQR